jgi:putative transposase
MKYYAEIHHRRSIRLMGWDYSQPGAYFITICTHDRRCIFGRVVNGEMRLSQIGQIVQRIILEIPTHFPGVVLGEFIIMPNHIHMILWITDFVGAGFTPAPVIANAGIPSSEIADSWRSGRPQGSPLRANLGQIVGAYKSLVVRDCLKIFKSNDEFMGKLWQRNYYEHIIQDDTDYERIAEYILGNPLKWEEDALFTK